mgnify:CR=1 FL=1
MTNGCLGAHCGPGAQAAMDNHYCTCDPRLSLSISKPRSDNRDGPNMPPAGLAIGF